MTFPLCVSHLGFKTVSTDILSMIYPTPSLRPPTSLGPTSPSPCHYLPHPSTASSASSILPSPSPFFPPPYFPPNLAVRTSLSCARARSFSNAGAGTSPSTLIRHKARSVS